MSKLGALAIVFFAVNAAERIARHQAWDALWTCHVACLLVGVGLLAKSGTLTAVGFCWLCFGIPLWLLDLAWGGELFAASVLTHVGGFALGFAGIRRLGFPRHAWWKASAALLGLLALSRAATPEHANVNLAFSVWEGYEPYFPTYSVYFAVVFGSSALLFLGVERALGRQAQR